MKILILIMTLFLQVSCQGQNAANENAKPGGFFEVNKTGKQYYFYNSDRSFQLDTSTYISFNDFDVIQKEKGPFNGVFQLNIKLNPSGTLRFEEMTKRNVGKQLCLVIGEKVMATTVINEVVYSGEGSLLVINQKGTEMLLDYLQSLRHLRSK